MDSKYLEGENHLSIKNRNKEEICLEKVDYEGKENVIIENLENCEVKIPFAVKCVYIKNITNCKIWVSAVQNASFIDSSVGTENDKN